MAARPRRVGYPGRQRIKEGFPFVEVRWKGNECDFAL